MAPDYGHQWKTGVVCALADPIAANQCPWEPDVSSLQNDAQALRVGDRSHLASLLVVLDGCDNVIVDWKPANLQLGEEKLAIQGDLKRRSPANSSIYSRVRYSSADVLHELPEAGIVTSSAAVLNLHFLRSHDDNGVIWTNR